MKTLKLIYEFYPIVFDYVLVVALVFSAGVIMTRGAARLFPRLRRHEYRFLLALVVAGFPLAAGPAGEVFSALVFKLLTLLFGPETYVHQWLSITAWLAVGAVLLYRLVRGWWRTRRWVAGLPSAEADPVFVAAVREVLPGRTVTLKRSGPDGILASWGGWHRVVLVPDRFMDDYTDEERRCIYLHELAHLRRRDSWLLLAASLYRCLVWFTPASRQALGRIQEGIEIACDRTVLRRSGVREFTYAELILKAQVQGAALAPGFSAAGLAEVRARIEQIVGSQIRPHRRLRDRVFPVLSLTLLFGITVFGYGLNAEYRRKWSEAVGPFQNGGNVVELDNGMTVRMMYTFVWRGALNSYGSAYSELIEDAVIAVPGGGSVTAKAVPNSSRYSF